MAFVPTLRTVGSSVRHYTAVDDSEIHEALSECVSTIVSAIRVALECTPPELSPDLSDRGIVLAAVPY